MADEAEDVRCFQLSIFLSTDNPAVAASFFAAAGDNHDEVVQQPPRFQTSELQRSKTVCVQLLEKLAQAVKDGSETIRIQVTDGGIIVPDPEAAAIGARTGAALRPKATAGVRAIAKAAPKKAQAEVDRKTPDKKRTPLKKKTPSTQQTKPKQAKVKKAVVKDAGLDKVAVKNAAIKAKPDVKVQSGSKTKAGVREVGAKKKAKKASRRARMGNLLGNDDAH